MTKKEAIPPRDCGITLEPKQKICITSDVAADWDRQKSILRQTRGNIIAYSLDIEFAMDVAIREMLFHIGCGMKDIIKEQIEKNINIFDRVISKSGTVSFNNKIKILETLLLENQILSEADIKRLFKLLKKVKSIRNKFAHTTIAFEPKTDVEKTSLIPYVIEDGKRVYLDGKYFDELNPVYSECLVRMENITRTIHKTPLEPVPKVALTKTFSGDLVS